MTPEAQAKKACPACGGTRGCTYTFTEIHDVCAEWDVQGELGQTTTTCRISLVCCSDCGARFNFDALQRKGLLK
jgi:hypothetical protein